MRVPISITSMAAGWRRSVGAGIILLLLASAVQHVSAQGENGLEPSIAVESTAADSIGAGRNIGAATSDVDLPAWHSMVTNLPGDWARSARMSVQPPGLQTIAGIGFLTATLVAADGMTYDRTQTAFAQNRWLRSGAGVMKYAGDGRSQLGVAAAFGIGGLIAGDSRAIRTASQTLEGLLASGIVVQLLKHVTGRESPAQASVEGGVWRFFPSLKSYQKNQSRYYAFPSGHIATTMTTVTIIAENYPELTWVRPVGYTIVGLVGVSLVGIKYHWYSDLPLGIAIGHVVGTVIARRNTSADEAANSEEGSVLIWQPSVGPAGAGVTVALRF